MEEFIELIGEEDGPTSVVLAGVHGNERGGIEALQNLIPKLKIEKGRVFFGYGNPRAIAANKRFTEANLNRMFKDDSLLSDDEKGSYEYERAQFIKKYLDQTDALLDIHSSFVPNSKPFIICENNAYSLVGCMPAGVVVSGFDGLEPGGTDYYVNMRGGVGICIECGYLDDSGSAKVATESILGFMEAVGNISGTRKPLPKTYFQIYEVYITKTDNFKLAKEFVDFEEIQPCQLIGVDGGEKVVAEKESIILFARNLDRVNDEAFILGEQKK